jgi:flagellar protein FliO/FliZ
MLGKTMVILQGTNLDIFSSTPTPTGALAEEVAKDVTERTTMDSFMQLVGLVFLLIVILIAAYYTSKFVGGIKLGQLKHSNFSVIDSYRIGPNKVMQIVKIGNKYIVIAIGKDTINVVTELEEADVFIKEINTSEKLNFKQILDKLKNKNE